MLMRHAMAVLLWLLMGSSCASAPATDVREALVAGDQREVDGFTRRFLSGAAVITVDALRDDRAVSRNVIVQVDEESRSSQYGVDRVSEYFMCLLQVKFQASSRDAAPRISSRKECNRPDQCEVCNSLTYPLSDQVRDEIREYWLERLQEGR
jgi:hypothetical protein